MKEGAQTMNLTSSMISEHHTSLWFPNTRIKVNYSNPKYNQVAMIRYIGMCVHIASRHSENFVIFIISYIQDQSRGGKKPQKQPTQVEYHYKGVF